MKIETMKEIINHFHDCIIVGIIKEHDDIIFEIKFNYSKENANETNSILLVFRNCNKLIYDDWKNNVVIEEISKIGNIQLEILGCNPTNKRIEIICNYEQNQGMLIIENGDSEIMRLDRSKISKNELPDIVFM